MEFVVGILILEFVVVASGKILIYRVALRPKLSVISLVAA
jgi:hypothetical protein